MRISSVPVCVGLFDVLYSSRFGVDLSYRMTPSVLGCPVHVSVLFFIVDWLAACFRAQTNSHGRWRICCCILHCACTVDWTHRERG